MFRFVLLCCFLRQALSATLDFEEKISVDIGPGDFIHQVIVGEDNSFLFAPNRLNANIGDQVNFSFRGRNHTLTQSSLERPCSPLHQFDTGFGQFNPQGRNNISITLTVNTLEPQWFFCKQRDPLSHCHAGMVFAINPGNKMEQFEENAKRASRATISTWSLPTFAGSASQSKTRPTGLEITPVTPAADMTTSSASSMGRTGTSAPAVIIFTKTVIKECPSSTLRSLTTATSSALKRNASVISAASANYHSGIGRKLGGLVFGFLLFQFR